MEEGTNIIAKISIRNQGPMYSGPFGGCISGLLVGYTCVAGCPAKHNRFLCLVKV